MSVTAPARSPATISAAATGSTALPSIGSRGRVALLCEYLSIRLAWRRPNRPRELDLRHPRARVRAAQHARTAHQPCTAMPARRRPDPTAGRPHLGGMQRRLKPKRASPERRSHPAEGRHRDAQFRHRADAVRAPVSDGRRRPHRAAHWRQGLNLAAADVRISRTRCLPLSDRLHGIAGALPERFLLRAQHFSWWMTYMLHRSKAVTV